MRAEIRFNVLLVLILSFSVLFFQACGTGGAQDEIPIVDSDNDGVADSLDACEGTQEGQDVNASGCSDYQLDSDSDGVSDAIDECEDTPTDHVVNAQGCSTAQLDSDGDDVSDALDLCSDTPEGVTVGDRGCTDQAKILYNAGAVGGSGTQYYTMDFDGSDAVLIANGMAAVGEARWSNDLSRVVFSSNDTSSGYHEIFLMDSDGTDTVQLTNHGESYGQHMPLFYSDDEIMWRRASQAGMNELSVMDLESSSQKVVTDFFSGGQSLSTMSFDFTRGKIYFSRGASSNSYSLEIYSADLDFSNEVKLTENSSVDIGPEISPDGTRIVFYRYTGAQPPLNLFVMKNDGTELQQITHGTGSECYSGPMWSPDGNRIYCTYYDGSQTDIVYMDVDGGNVINITNTSDIRENLCDIRDDVRSFSVTDSDEDGVSDLFDDCENTQQGRSVNESGCSVFQIDSDQDSYSDAVDECADTPLDEEPNASGCSISQIDSDNDGIFDDVDLCNDTPDGTVVASDGCEVSPAGLTGYWSMTLTETENNGCSDDPEEASQTWVIEQNGRALTVTADPDDPAYTGSLQGNTINFNVNIDGDVETQMAFTFADETSLTGTMEETITWDGGSCSRTYSLSGTKADPPKMSYVFHETFESGLSSDIWNWNVSNWQGEKTLITENPYEGSTCLFMKGSDWSTGGCSNMQTITSWNLKEAVIYISFRDAAVVDGTGGDGGAVIYLMGPENAYICRLQDNYDSSYFTDPEVSVSDNDFFLNANSTNYGTGIALAGLSGWHTLKIHYQSSDATGTGAGNINIYLDSDGTPILSQSITSAPLLDSIMVGAIGQYNNTGEWYIDDIIVEDPSDHDLLYTSTKVGESASAMYTMKADGTNRLKVPMGKGGGGQWSDDQSRIVFSDVSDSGHYEIFILNSDGTGRLQLTDEQQYYGQGGPVFFSDTEIMWTHSMGAGHSEIAIMGIDGSNQTDLTNSYAEGKQANSVMVDRVNNRLFYYKQNSSWSPTGEIYSADYDFSNETQLTANSTCDNQPMVSPDGSTVVFTRREAANGYSLPANIYTMDTDGSNVVKITTTTGNTSYGGMRWSRDGSYIFCTHYDGTQSDIYKISLDGTTRINITNTSDINESLSDVK